MTTTIVDICVISGALAWPEGTYGIPMAESGCPHAENFEWLTGELLQ